MQKEEYDSGYGGENLLFVHDHTVKLDAGHLTIARKTNDCGLESRYSSSPTIETEMQKKIDMPKFSGDILDFPGFQRR